MDEGTERRGLFAKGGVGRFFVALTIGAMALFTVGCGVVVVLGAVMEHFLGTSEEQLAASKSEGVAFASGHTLTECVTEAQARGARCEALAPGCPTAVGAFARECIVAATDDGYCAAIPKPTGDDVMSYLNTFMAWQRAACAPSPGLWCQEVMGEVHSGCLARMRPNRDAARTTDDASTEP